MKRFVSLSLAALMASSLSAGAVNTTSRTQETNARKAVVSASSGKNANEIWKQLCEQFGVPYAPLPGNNTQNKPDSTPVVKPDPKPDDTPVETPDNTPVVKPDQKPDTDTGASQSSYAAEVVRLVNAERAKNGLSALKASTAVTRAAQVRAGEIRTSFSHTRPNGTSCFTALGQAGASYRGAGENIAYGQATPAAVMNSWMNSSGHRANILNSKFTTIGVGYTVINGTPYWIQMFTY